MRMMFAEGAKRGMMNVSVGSYKARAQGDFTM